MLRRKQKVEEPIYKILDVSNIDTGDYQRDVNMSRVRKYSKEFDWKLFGVPVVSVRNGKFYAVDGQHRIELLKLLGIERVMCQLLCDLNYEQEADIFVRINSERGSLSSNQKFHGRVEAKESVALLLVDIMKSHGFMYSKNPGLEKDNYISAVACIESIYNRYGEERLHRILNIFRKAWCGSPASLKRDFIQGVSVFLNETNGVDDDLLCAALERVSPNALKLQAHVFAGNSMSGTKELYVYVGKAIRDIYKEYIKASKKSV